MAFGLFHLHRIWGLIDRISYAGFWMGALENKGLFYFVLMGILAMLCILGVVTFIQNRHSNYWWRWIYLFGGIYVLFDLFAIAVGLEFWNRLLLWMFDVNSRYWNAVWLFFILLGGFVFALGIKLWMQRNKYNVKNPFKIDKRVLCILIICAAVILSVGVSWKYMTSDTDVYLDNEVGGRLLKEAVYDNDDSSLQYYIEYSYDEAGNLVKVISYDEDGNVLASNYAHEPEDYYYFGWREFSYDEAGNQVKYIEYDKYGAVAISEEFSYDETGNLTKSILSCENDGSGSWSEFSYDEAGNMIEIGEQYGNKYSFNNYQWEKRYDSSGNLLKETKLFDDGSWNEETYSYDNLGNLVKKTSISDDEDVNERIYSYDNSDNLIKETYQNYRGNEYINGNPYGIIYGYDEAGNLVTKQGYDADGGIIDSETHTYSYDRAGNLIKDACSVYYIIYTYE